MRLDRNANPDGKGKYALIKLREDDVRPRLKIPNIVTVPVEASAIDLGDTPDTEFFVIRLKDKNAANALMAYAVSCRVDDPQFANEVHELALRAASHQRKTRPT
jgi:hypothetical protein